MLFQDYGLTGCDRHYRFKAWTRDAASASAALSAWSVADSGDTQDIMVSEKNLISALH